MDRAKVVFGHLSQRETQQNTELYRNDTASVRFPESDDDVVIVTALRTPICKSRRGGFKDTLPDDLLAAALVGVIKDVNLDPALIGDICIGNVNQPGTAAIMARMAQFMAHIPETVPIQVVNRQCSSGLQACLNIAGSIKSGFYDIGIGGGVESMTVDAMGRGGFNPNPRAMDIEKAVDCLIPMGITSENVAERFGVSREKQDKMAFESHAKAARAQQTDRFRDEIIPIDTIITDKDGNEKPVRISKDDGVRPGTTMEILAKLRPAFKEGGSTTAGNASQTSDGAAAVILARRSAAKKHNLPILGVLRGYAVTGVPPDVMGIGPAYAIPKALANAGVSQNDIEVFEINEAFASQAVYSVEKLGIPMEKVNPNGGAIALGHPLGCTGARQIATLLHELKHRGKPALGVVSMCIGTGMGAAAVIEYPAY